MRQGDFIRVLASLAAAGTGAGLALGGAAVTGNLGNRTTIEQFTEASAAKAGGSSGSGLSVEQIYRLDAPGVVEITTSNEGRSSPTARSRALGSGFVIDTAGHIVTNNHVIAGARLLRVSFSGNDEMNAHLVGRDPSTDVAVLQVDAHSRSLSPLPLGDSDNVEVGDAVVAIGNPLSLTRTATAGIVSALQRTIDSPKSPSMIEHSIQTDAAINRGNAGGPLIDTQGEVIGINAQSAVGGASQGSGAGLAIPIDTVKTVVAQLIRSGTVEHAFLGLSALPVTASLARMCDLPTQRGLLVQTITGGSAASEAGLKGGETAVVVAGESYRVGGDIIVAANGAPISSETQLRNVLEAMKPGDNLRLTVWRGARRHVVRVVLGKPPA